MSVSERKLLQINDLAVSFRTDAGILQAVRGISLHVDRGETLAIVGESGSGKSVTARSILGISARNAITECGEILFYGDAQSSDSPAGAQTTNSLGGTQSAFPLASDASGRNTSYADLLKYSEDDFNKIRGNKIAMVFQDPLSSLDPIMTIGQQLTEAMILTSKRRPKSERIDKKTAKARAIEIMREVGIPEPEKRFYQYPFEFSGGMRQRIVIAIAVSAQPELLICDEPTTALDVTIQAQILKLINRLKRERQMSVIFITHDLGVVANVADRVAVMYAGKIIEEGTTEDIFFRPAHPYTWVLLSAVPDLDTPQGSLTAIPGTPPDMTHPPKGDAFAMRSDYAMKIDFEREPPLFPISDTHRAATWLLHPDAPKMEMPKVLRERISRMTQVTR